MKKPEIMPNHCSFNDIVFKINEIIYFIENDVIVKINQITNVIDNDLKYKSCEERRIIKTNEDLKDVFSQMFSPTSSVTPELPRNAYGKLLKKMLMYKKMTVNDFAKTILTYSTTLMNILEGSRQPPIEWIRLFPKLDIFSSKELDDLLIAGYGSKSRLNKETD